MIIDTIMALSNRILGSNLKKVVITSFLFGIGLLCLLIMIGIPAFSHSSKVARHAIPFIDLANKKEHAISTQLFVDDLSTPPATPIVSIVVPPQPITVSNVPSQTNQAPELPASLPAPAIIVPTKVPFYTVNHPTATHQTVQGTKKVKSRPIRMPSPTSIPPTATAMSMPMSKVLPTPTPSVSTSPTPTLPAPAKGDNLTPAPLPTTTGTVPVDPKRTPVITVTPTANQH